MDPDQFADDFPGELNYDGTFPTYVPEKLPPEIEQSGELIKKMGDARGAIGKLSGISGMVENYRMLLLRPFIRREAVYSSRIEGTYATVSAVYAIEAGEEEAIVDASERDSAEVYNYVQATEEGLSRIEDEKLSEELLKDLHNTLMSDVRGGDKSPGEFRNDQRAIGDQDPHLARFVPPEPHRIPYEMENLIDYANSGPIHDPLVDIAIIHYQFETIHPFADGNGRMGRLLITLLLNKYGLLKDPFLYLSSYFNARRDEYVDRLFGTNARGEWEEWIKFFLDAVIDQSREVVLRSRELVSLREEYMHEYDSMRYEALIPLIRYLLKNPITTISKASEGIDKNYQATRNAINQLESDGVLSETTGKSRYKTFKAAEIMNVIEYPIEELVEDMDEKFENQRSLKEILS